MIQATEQDRERILEYLKQDLSNCIYLYIDIANYGICSEHMKVWYNEESGQLTLVVMQYYDSYQVYSHKLAGACGDCTMAAVQEVQWLTQEIAGLLQQHPVTMISGRQDLIEAIAECCPEYEATYGAIFVMDRFRKVPESVPVTLASPEDAEEIARLICSDAEIGGHYTVDVLAAQLRERMITGTGRSYIIRENDDIVAHSATYAEAPGVAVVGGTIIREDCRSGNYYLLLSNYMMQQLDNEGKKAYTFAIADKMIDYHKLMHTMCGEYGKLVRRM